MRSNCREDIVDRLDALHEVVSDLLELSFDVLTTPELLGLPAPRTRDPAAASDAHRRSTRRVGQINSTDWSSGQPRTNERVIVCTHIQAVYSGVNITSPSTCAQTAFSQGSPENRSNAAPQPVLHTRSTTRGVGTDSDLN